MYTVTYDACMATYINIMYNIISMCDHYFITLYGKKVEEGTTTLL